MVFNGVVILIVIGVFGATLYMYQYAFVPGAKVILE